MTINFVCDFPGEFAFPVGESYPRLLESPIFYKMYASVRIRCLLPLATIGRKIPSRLVSYHTLLKSSERFAADDRFVLFKAGSTSVKKQSDLARGIATFAERHRAHIVYDTCDPAHADNDPTVAYLQTALLKQAALVTCATDELAKDLRPLTGAPVQVIEDSIDCPQAPPKFAPGNPVRMVWFGWMARLRFTDLANRLADIQTIVTDQRITCLILAQDIAPEGIADVNAFLDESGKGKTTVSHRRWDLPEAWKVIADHDLVLIPHDLEADGTARFKSHNRLSTAIRSGVFAVASPVPAYKALADYCWLGDNLAEGVAWALTHTHEARRRIAAGQTRVDELYGPEAIGARWIEALTEFAAG